MNEKLGEKLMKLKCGEQFVGVLQAAINKAHGIKTPRKRKSEWQEGNAVAAKRPKGSMENASHEEITLPCDFLLSVLGTKEARREHEASAEERAHHKTNDPQGRCTGIETVEQHARRNDKCDSVTAIEGPLQQHAIQDRSTAEVGGAETDETVTTSQPSTNTLASLDEVRPKDGPCEDRDILEMESMPESSEVLRKAIEAGNGNVANAMKSPQSHGTSSPQPGKNNYDIGDHSQQHLGRWKTLESREDRQPSTAGQMGGNTSLGTSGSESGLESALDGTGIEKAKDKEKSETKQPIKLKLTHRGHASTPFTHSLIIDHLASKAMSISAEV